MGCDVWGVLEEEEAERVFSSRLPFRLRSYLHSILYWDERIGFVEGMDQVLSYLSSQGKGIYLLSNASHRLNEYFPSFPFSHYFKDTVVSADYNRVKPEAELFRLALSKFGIDAKDTLTPERGGRKNDRNGGIPVPSGSGKPSFLHHWLFQWSRPQALRDHFSS